MSLPTTRYVLTRTVEHALSVFGPAPAIMVTIKRAEIETLVVGRILAIDAVGITIAVEIAELGE